MEKKKEGKKKKKGKKKKARVFCLGPFFNPKCQFGGPQRSGEQTNEETKRRFDGNPERDRHIQGPGC
jgi:hypothetical protein